MLLTLTPHRVSPPCMHIQGKGVRIFLTKLFIKQIEMKTVDLIFCMFKGHRYSRFERRNPTCIHCDSIQESKIRRIDIERRNTYDTYSNTQKYESTQLQYTGIN